jgi:hypothetical protein
MAAFLLIGSWSGRHRDFRQNPVIQPIADPLYEGERSLNLIPTDDHFAPSYCGGVICLLHVLIINDAHLVGEEMALLEHAANEVTLQAVLDGRHERTSEGQPLESERACQFSWSAGVEWLPDNPMRAG